MLSFNGTYKGSLQAELNGHMSGVTKSVMNSPCVDCTTGKTVQRVLTDQKGNGQRSGGRGRYNSRGRGRFGRGGGRGRGRGNFRGKSRGGYQQGYNQRKNYNGNYNGNTHQSNDAASAPPPSSGKGK